MGDVCAARCAVPDDLNLIEHLWDLIRRDMNRGPLAQTVNDLRKAVDVAWQRLPQTAINRLFDRMRHRMKACIASCRTWAH
ncbi:hypothetical protein TNCV_4509301 [Trichonephila clavipes]|nr:hypothetical protein TNCV_4509301 [Trichonephila clavipes]